MIFAPTNRRIIRPGDKPSFEHTQRYGLIKGHPLGPAGGLVCFPIMNEGSGNKIVDLSGNGNSGILNGTALVWKPGPFGPVISFPATDEYVDFGATVLTAVNNFSMTIWINWAGTTGSNEVIISNGDSGADGYDLRLTAAESNNIEILCGGVGYADSDTSLTANTWQHLVAMRDNGTWRIVLDSVELSVTGNPTPSTPATNTKLGARQDGAGAFFSGMLDIPLFYNRVLAMSEIAFLIQKPFCMVQRQAAPVYFFIPTGEVKEITGTIDAQSVVSGSIEVFKSITGTVDAAATVAGSIKVSRKLTGTVDAQGVVTGDLSAVKKLSGTVTCTSTVTGSLTIPAGGLSAYAELKILDHIVGKATYSKPVVAIGLCTADPGNDATGASCNEVTNTNGYGRIAVPDTDWNDAAGGEIDNANPITFPEATGSWGEITHYVLLDSTVYGQGNVLAFDELDLAKTIIDDEIVNFAAGQLKFALT